MRIYRRIGKQPKQSKPVSPTSKKTLNTENIRQQWSQSLDFSEIINRGSINTSHSIKVRSPDQKQLKSGDLVNIDSSSEKQSEDELQYLEIKVPFNKKNRNNLRVDLKISADPSK